MKNQFNESLLRHGYWEYEWLFGLACSKGYYENGVKLGYWEEHKINPDNNIFFLESKKYYI